MHACLHRGLALLLAASLPQAGHADDWRVETVVGSVEISTADQPLAVGDRLPADTAVWLASPDDRVLLLGAGLRAWSAGTAALRAGRPVPASAAQIRVLEILDGALRLDSGATVVLLNLSFAPMLTQGDVWLRASGDALQACIVDGQLWVNAEQGDGEIRHFDERYACIERRADGWHLERPNGLLFNRRLMSADGGERPVYMEDIQAAREPTVEGQQNLFRLPEQAHQ